jgi:ferredoxin
VSPVPDPGPAPAAGVVELDPLQCQGTGYCVAVCPDVFELDDRDGVARVRGPSVPADLLDAVEEAESLCPTAAIHLQTARRPS